MNKIFSLTFLFLIGFAPHTHAVITQTLTNVPGNWESFVGYVVSTMLALGAALAVLMIVIGGVQILLYGGSQNAQSAGKEKLTNAFVGLVILSLSYLALNTINSSLVSFGF